MTIMTMPPTKNAYCTMHRSALAKSSSGIIGSVRMSGLRLAAARAALSSRACSHATQAAYDTPATTKHAMTRASDHASLVAEPQLSARRRVMPPAMKKKAPTQSTRSSFCLKVSRTGDSAVEEGSWEVVRGCAPLVRPRRIKKQRTIATRQAGRL